MPVDDYWGTESTELNVDEAVEVDLQGNPIVAGLDRDIPKSIIDAKGDLIVGAGADTPARLAAGAVGQALVVAADGSLDWETPASAEHTHDIYATDADLAAHAATSHGTAHPDLASHDSLGLATQSELDAHAATAGHTHPNLAAHDTLGLATQAELDGHVAAADPHTGYLLESKIVHQASAPASPVAGDLWIDTDEAPSAGLSSILAFAETSTVQTVGTTITPLTGLSVTVTVPAGRRLRVTGRVGVNQGANNGLIILIIMKNGVQTGRGYVSDSGQFETVDASFIDSPAAGTYTYRLDMSTSAGTFDTITSSDKPYILVEDITGSLWPAGQSVDVGMLPVLDQCTVYNTANISIPDNVSTAITFNSERYDPRDMHSTVSLTDRVNILRTGVYHIQFTGQMAGASDYVQVLAILQINATSDIAYSHRVVSIGTNPAIVNVSKTIKLTVGDYVRALIYQDNTANAARNLEVNGFVSPELSVSYIGPG